MDVPRLIPKSMRNRLALAHLFLFMATAAACVPVAVTRDKEQPTSYVARKTIELLVVGETTLSDANQLLRNAWVSQDLDRIKVFYWHARTTGWYFPVGPDSGSVFSEYLCLRFTPDYVLAEMKLTSSDKKVRKLVREWTRTLKETEANEG